MYEIGRKVAEVFKANLGILFDTLLPRWNYVAGPLLMRRSRADIRGKKTHTYGTAAEKFPNAGFSE